MGLTLSKPNKQFVVIIFVSLRIFGQTVLATTSDKV
jgi:hypothetical protein